MLKKLVPINVSFSFMISSNHDDVKSINIENLLIPSGTAVLRFNLSDWYFYLFKSTFHYINLVSQYVTRLLSLENLTFNKYDIIVFQ